MSIILSEFTVDELRKAKLKYNIAKKGTSITNVIKECQNKYPDGKYYDELFRKKLTHEHFRGLCEALDITDEWNEEKNEREIFEKYCKEYGTADLKEPEKLLENYENVVKMMEAECQEKTRLIKQWEARVKDKYDSMTLWDNACKTKRMIDFFNTFTVFERDIFIMYYNMKSGERKMCKALIDGHEMEKEKIQNDEFIMTLSKVKAGVDRKEDELTKEEFIKQYTNCILLHQLELCEENIDKKDKFIKIDIDNDFCDFMESIHKMRLLYNESVVSYNTSYEQKAMNDIYNESGYLEIIYQYMKMMEAISKNRK